MQNSTRVTKFQNNMKNDSNHQKKQDLKARPGGIKNKTVILTLSTV